MPNLFPLGSRLSDDAVRALLSATKTIAIVGAKDKPGQPVEHVGRYLIAAGYQVIPVHPVRREVWGLKAYPSLADVPVPVDLVNIFRAPEYCAGHAREAAQLAPVPRVFWMQLGITSQEATHIAEQAGMTVIQDTCIEVLHRKLFPHGEQTL